MSFRQSWFVAALCLGLFGVVPATVNAEIIRFRYASGDSCGNAALVPGPDGASGGRQAWIGGPIVAYPRVPTATHILGLRHAYTGQTILVPVTLPDGVARVEHRGDRIIYNFGTYQVQAISNADGTVTTLYNSGALRPIAFR